MGRRIYEKMVRLEHLGWTIRGWLDHTPGKEVMVEIHENVFREVVKNAVTPRTTLELAKHLADVVPSLNAVEVLDHDGNGFLAYNDWP